MTRFGPAGSSESFKEQGYRHTHQAPKWLAERGLTALEYSSGHGIQLGEETARKIGGEAARYGIAISIHAPYYINLAQEYPDKLASTIGYLRESAIAVRAMGGNRVIFHPGSSKGANRREAMHRACKALEAALSMPEAKGMLFCPETAGRQSQLGLIEDLIDLCGVSDSILPAIDFAHLHALDRLNGLSDYRRVLDQLLEALGMERMRNFHIHFSHIEYTDKGERRHRNFDEEGYGPDFRPLAQLLREYGLEPVVICESRGHQAEDAMEMKRLYEEVLP